MFRHTKVSQMPRRRSYLLKYLTMFFLGASCVVLTIQASGTVNIDTNLSNAVQYIKDIVLTSNGSNAGGTTGIILGGDGSAFFSGNVGIGIESPSAQFQIDGNSGSIKMGNLMSAGTGASLMSFHGDIVSGQTGLLIGQYNNAGSFPLRGGLINGDGPLYLGSKGHPLSVNITNLGNVGIGTTTPTEQLQVGNYAWIGNDVNKTTGGNFLRILSNDVYVYEPNIQLNTNRQDDPGQPIHYENWKITNNANLDFQYATGSMVYSSLLTLKTNGNVGIGKFSPGAKLEVNGNIRLSNAGHISVGSSNPNQLYLSSDGKVGIGTPAPSALLTVEGGIKPQTLTTDPCSDTISYPAGTIFFNPNVNAGALCWCNELQTAVLVYTMNTSCY